LDYVSPDKSNAVLFVYQLETAVAKPVKPGGLDPRRHYRLHEVNLPPGASSKLALDGQLVDGQTLMRTGLVPPCTRPFDSSVILLTAEK
jgi:alpha-galactosidase